MFRYCTLTVKKILDFRVEYSFGRLGKRMIFSVLNLNILLLILGLFFIAVAKTEIYSGILQYLFLSFRPSFQGFVLYPGNPEDLFFLIKADLIFFVALLSSYLFTKNFITRSRLVDSVFLLINAGYAFLAFANLKWIAESGMMLDFGTLIFGFRQFSDAMLVIKEYASGGFLLSVGLLMAYLVFYFRHHRLFLHLPLQKGEKVMIAMMFCVSMIGVVTYDAAKAEKAAHMHSQIVRNASSVHLQMIKEAATSLTKIDHKAHARHKTIVAEIDSLHKTPNIVLIGLESTRLKSTPFAAAEGIADIAEMPYLAEIAREGVLVKNVRTPLPRTSKSLAAVISGKTPVVSSYLAETELNYPLTGLPDYLKKFGYQSAYFQSPIGYFERRPALIHNLGFDQFLTVPEIHPDTEIIGYLNADDHLMVEPALNWASEQETPFLLTLFTSITHHPYMLPGEYDPALWEKFKTTMSAEEKYHLYKKALTYSDGFIKEVIEGLKAKGLMENTIVVIFGDHGEGFGEKGILAHSQNPNEEVLRIPLIFYGKDFFDPGQQIDGFYSSIDIVPTILGKMGAHPMPADIEGVNIFGSKPNRKLFFSVWFDGSLGGMIDENGRKFIFDPVSESFEVYNLKADPWEKKNLFSSMQEQGFDFEAIKDEIVAWKIEHCDQGYDSDKNEIKKISNWQCQATANGVCFVGDEPEKQLRIDDVD